MTVLTLLCPHHEPGRDGPLVLQDTGGLLTLQSQLVTRLTELTDVPPENLETNN